MPWTIVCGVDKSDAAVVVADTAQWLAHGLDARLRVVHVAEEARPDAEELLASIRERLSLSADDARLVEGSPTDRLLAAVEDDGADLLVVVGRETGEMPASALTSLHAEAGTSSAA